MVEDSQRSLMERAGALLRRRAHSRGELEDKLSRWADPLEVGNTLDRLEELDLLNDPRYAYNLALLRMREAGWGPERVRGLLLDRRLQGELIESVLEKIEQEFGFERLLSDYVDKLCRRKGIPSQRRGIQRLLQHLRRRGFYESHMHFVLRRKIGASAWKRFETGD